MTREEAQAIYRAGEETVVRVLVELSARVDQFTADFALREEEIIGLRERVRTLKGQLARPSRPHRAPPTPVPPISKPLPTSSKSRSSYIFNCRWTSDTIASSRKAENPVQPSGRPQRRGARKQSKALNLLDRFRDRSPRILASLDQLRCSLRQQPSRTRRAHDKGPPENFRHFPPLPLNALHRIFLGDPFLRLLASS